ncbi:hypothetical protein CMQ_3364 [Grosmannia clavigera kw1407]|uniref:Uncharacterized protein n=1 Tax=Grosmannia clavigera (strain kw1407 / UAMH 11150) TaxID=655863 RepID=F0XA04_GROCL|nr:uncharacterized protein CMQ_3364 [Grosmannia clavigera kw1407]EFX05295.1 hypothetical protein CMQ_3364 [Grosmannia clavigera kw1407]
MRSTAQLYPPRYDDADEIRDRLHDSLVAFLEAAEIPKEMWTFYFWVSGIAEPSEMFQDGVSNGEADRFVVLYTTNIGLAGHSTGLVYDQRTHRATMALGIEDLDFSQPPEQHSDLWHPLETVLTQWIEMIRIGKITASPEDEGDGDDSDERVGSEEGDAAGNRIEKATNEKLGPWTWHAYSATQVDSAVAASNRLASAIESRMPEGSLLPESASPLLRDADLDAAAVPANCFIRSFLTHIRPPRFSTIAPGLLVPHDAARFARQQRFTRMDYASADDGQHIIPPVLIFSAEGDRTVNFDSDSRYISHNPFCRAFADGVPAGDHSVPAGLYSESVERTAVDNAEEGFRLLLPYCLREAGQEDSGAKKSDGGYVEKKSVADLFQHGFKPFGGEWWRAQRLERLFDRWRELVESRVWAVCETGVQGSIDIFKDADTTRTRDYWIAPSW